MDRILQTPGFINEQKSNCCVSLDDFHLSTSTSPVPESTTPTLPPTNASSSILPICALLFSQSIQSSWHVLGKHVMHTVPYLTPISYVLIRTGVTSCMLLLVGRYWEGRVDFPKIFLDKKDDDNKENSQFQIPYASTISTTPMTPNQHHHHRPRRKRRHHSKPSLINTTLAILVQSPLKCHDSMTRQFQRSVQNLNPQALQIIVAGISGMLLLPLLYTTGLILTTPTVVSVWDGPMIPLGCFLSAVLLGVEKRSKLYPNGQICSLFLAVGGSLIVLLIDYTGGANSINTSQAPVQNNSNHWTGRTQIEFLRGNMVLMGLVAAYCATTLLQKQLRHFPSITLTGWFFGFGFLGCLSVVIFDSLLEMIRNNYWRLFWGGASSTGRAIARGTSLSGCTLQQSLQQLHQALCTSPTFRYGIIYACFFVGGTCYSISSYASSHLESSVITLFAACQPPMTAVMEWIWEGKGLGMGKVCGMVLVGAGMWGFTWIKRVEKDCKSGHRYGIVKRNHGHGKSSKVLGVNEKDGAVVNNIKSNIQSA